MEEGEGGGGLQTSFLILGGSGPNPLFFKIANLYQQYFLQIIYI